MCNRCCALMRLCMCMLHIPIAHTLNSAHMLQCTRINPRTTHPGHVFSVLAQAHCRTAARLDGATLDELKQARPHCATRSELG
eukprot:6179293-Pleurochrysis_carterae.AAC.4